jgi:hypothetical protein
VGTWFHVASSIDYAITQVGSNIVKEEVDRVFCGNTGLGLVGADGAESN